MKTRKTKQIEELERENKKLRAERDTSLVKLDFQKSRADFYETEYKAKKDRPSWNFLLVAVILSAIVTALIGFALDTHAATVNRYTTQKVSLLDKVKGKKVYTVKRNTELKILKEGKTWARVRYKGKDLSVKKKYLNAEKLLGKKKSRYYINYLHTRGPVHWRGRKYTYYTSRLCPIYKLPVPGLHLDKDGFWCDKRDYIVLGSSVQNKINRTVYATPFGKYGKVYDTGGYSTPSWLCDVATSW